MKYLKVFTNFRRSMEGLTDEEKGRLFDAMLMYAETGEEPTFSGNERFIWGSVLNMFEAQQMFNDKQRANGIKGGRPAKPKETQQNPNNPDEPNITQANPENPKRKEKKRNEKKINIEDASPFEIALDEFRQYRKEKHNPLGEIAEKKLLKELDRLSGGNEETKIQILDQSIRNGWAGVFELRNRKASGGYEQHKVTDAELSHLLVNLDD